MAKAKHCISCGKKGVHWPSYDPEACTQRCAADSFLAYASTGAFEAAHCPECGGCGAPCDHKKGCPALAQESAAKDEYSEETA